MTTLIIITVAALLYGVFSTPSKINKEEPANNFLY
jgi:hypothetical protein